MRVLLVGATSSLAPTIIPLLLSSPYIHSLILLSRTSIKSAKVLSDPKVTQILCQDFTQLPSQLFTTARDARLNAVIWLVGGPVSRFPSFPEAEAANLHLPVALFERLLDAGVVPTPSGHDDGDKPQGRYADYSAKQPFRFVYLSQAGAEQNQTRSLWRDGANRKLKGAAEKALMGLAADKGQGMAEVYCLRLGTVLRGGQTTQNVLWEAAGGYISDELIGKKVLSLTLGGRAGKEQGSAVLENNDCLGDDWAEINSNTVGV